MKPHPLLLVCALSLASTGCATWQEPAPFDPQALRIRAEAASSQDVEVRAAVPAASESQRIFGMQPERDGVQPLWLEIRNGTSGNLWLQLSGIDPEHFSAREVAWPAHVKFDSAANDRIDDHLARLQFPNPIPPGQTRSGFVYTNPHPETKLVNIDLLGDRRMIPLSLLVDIPGGGDLRGDQQSLARALGEFTDHEDLEVLRPALDRLPHCAASLQHMDCRSPLNLVLVGAIEDVGAALVRRGFRRDFRDGDRDLLVYGRAPDVVLRRSVREGTSAAWLRIWRSPVNYRGQPVYVAQVARPAGGRFARVKTGSRMHADVDEARNLYLEDSLYSGGLESFGFLSSKGAVPKTPPGSGGPDPGYFTDGLRAVLFFATRPLTISDVEFLDWEPLPVR